MAEDAVTATAATRQRRKRKWDQPAEAVASASAAMPGLLPFTAAGALSGLGALPGVFPYINYLPAVPTTTVQSASAQITPATLQQNAAAIMQKFNQDLASKGILLQAKIQDELIAREITINDAEAGVRYKLTKRQTQEEDELKIGWDSNPHQIQLKTGAVVITRGRYRPPNGQVDHEKPLYLHISAGVNLKDTAERIKAVDQAAAMVEDMLKQGQQTQVPLRSPLAGNAPNGNVPTPVTLTILVGFEADPSFNLVGRIRGPNDQYINHIMTETGASVVLRGRGSGNKEGASGEELPQPLHLLITSDNPKRAEDAKTLAENLLETIRADSFPYRLPNYQLLPSSVPSVSSPTLMSYPTPQQAPYQASPLQNPYGGYYPSMGGAYPPPYAINEAPSPSFPPATVTNALDQAASPLLNAYTNLLPSTKVYGAVPPPMQLLGAQPTETAGTATIGSVEKKAHVRIREKFSQSATNDSPSPSLAPATPSASNSAVSGHTQSSVSNAGRSGTALPHISSPQFLQQHLSGASFIQSAGQVSQPLQGVIPGQSFLPAYSQPFASSQTHGPVFPSYGGYGGVYPEASPLQQVAQALQRPPLPVSVKPLPNAAFLATLTKAQSSSFQDKYPEKQPAQRRKFQEFPVGGKDSSAEEQQGRRGMIASGPGASTASQDPRPSKSMPPPPPRSMPPPPSKNMPPPKPVSSAAPAKTALAPSTMPYLSLSPSVSSGFKQLNEHAAPHGTGLKLVEYGEEEEESFPGHMPALQSKPFSNGKPFWAA